VSVTTAPSHSRVARTVSRESWVARAGVMLLVAWLLLSIALPLWALLSKSFQNANGEFSGLANYIRYFSTPSLFNSIFNSIWVALVTTIIVIPLAFGYAYALTRSQMKFKGLFYAAAMLPLFAPSLLSAISLIYLFGNQGLLKGLLFGGEIYGANGIIVAQVF
jgi:iron(III) transport system permease protein